MNMATLGRYLVGHRQAILDVAFCKHGLWLGLLFVLSAGLAREYDGEDLLHEPWHAFLPLAASLGSSLLLYLLVYLVSLPRGERRWPNWPEYRAVLQLFWMTAPLAWLYAIPVERFLSPADAVRGNLWFLGLVSLWRVLLISRALSVLYQVRFVFALAVVMLFAETVVLVLLYLTPIPVMSLMGGIRLTESEQLIQGIAFLVGVLGVLSWPIWLTGALGVAFGVRWNFIPQAAESRLPVHWTGWAFGAVCLVAGAAILPFAQPEQQNRGEVERLLRQDKLNEAIRFLSARQRADFPPHWDPPPRIAYHQWKPSLLELRLAVEEPSVAPWVRQMVIDKMEFQRRSYPFGPDWVQLYQMDDAEFRRTLDILKKIPEGPRIAYERRNTVQIQRYAQPDTRTPERRAMVAEFLQFGETSEEAQEAARNAARFNTHSDSSQSDSGLDGKPN